jgi:hypothetical protein
MTKREEYQLSFQTQVTSNNRLYHFATTNNLASGDIAGHLTDSDEAYITRQIRKLNDAINGEGIEGLWVQGPMGSSLEVFPANGIVEVGDIGMQMPIEDFKELLEEWLAFIQQ